MRRGGRRREAGGTAHRHVKTIDQMELNGGRGAVGEIELAIQQEHGDRLPKSCCTGCTDIWRECSRRLGGGGERIR